MDSDLGIDCRKLTVLFGSQTGSAEDTARRIGRDGVRRHMDSRVCTLDEYSIASLVDESLVIFVVATTGQGDPPDNMKQFWRFIWRKNLLPGCLATLKFALVGFGDSSYQKFNFIAKKLRKRLIQLGATEIVSAGFADDQHDFGADAVVGPWLCDLWRVVGELFPLPEGVAVIPDDNLLPPRYKVMFLDGAFIAKDTSDAVDGSCEGRSPVSEHRPFRASVTDNKRVTASDHWQDVRLLTLDITNSDLKYSPGDVCHIQPKNLPDTVDEFMTLLSLNPCAVVTVSSSGQDEVPPRLRCPQTIQHLVECYLDINSIPRRYFWELMAQFTDSNLEKSKLQEFCSPEGQDDLYSYCNRPKRSILEVMKDFPGATAHIPIDYLFDMIPALRSRAFSIASCQMVCPNEVQLLVAVVKYKTNLAVARRGVCSNYLAGLTPSAEREARVPMWIEKGLIQFPNCPKKNPVIMIGPGTGCAPFRAYIQQRAADAIGGNVLFFGCRNREKDFYFQQEWQHLESDGLVQLFVAFSRDQSEKVYVQHILAQQSALVWNLLEQEAYFFVAGNSKNMPDSVRQELKKVIIKESGRTEEQADEYLSELEQRKRYQLETWS